jgi:hypothetical protein
MRLLVVMQHCSNFLFGSSLLLWPLLLLFLLVIFLIVYLILLLLGLAACATAACGPAADTCAVQMRLQWTFSYPRAEMQFDWAVRLIGRQTGATNGAVLLPAMQHVSAFV